MSKLTQAEIKRKADEWAVLGLKIQKLQDAMAKDLKPFSDRFHEETAEIQDKYELKIGELTQQQLAVEREVLAALDEIDKPIVLAGETAAAVNEIKIGSRAIDARKFFDFVREKNEAFWSCVSVGIAKAEALIGKKSVDEMSTKPTKLVSSLKLK